MGLNIDELLKLDRLRDTKVEGTGVKRRVEICRNPEKVLKETEEYTYETVEVIDGAFVKEKGIVDEIVRMTFHDETYERSLNNSYRSGKSTKELNGFYLRYKQTDESHPFNLLFRKSGKAYMNKFKREDGRETKEQCYEDDHRSQARLLVFEILCGANIKFNETFRKTFNLDITNINDFKIILLDLELAKDVQKYIVKTVATEASKIAFKGRNNDYITIQKKKNGIRETSYKQLNTIELDKKYGNDSDSDAYEFLELDEGVYVDDEIKIHDKLVEDEEVLRREDNLYKYILQNIESILTKKQLLYLKAYLNNKDEEYLGTIDAANKSEDGMRAVRFYYKDKIKKYIEQYLNRDLCVTKVNDKFEFKQSVLVALETILKKGTHKDIFIELCRYLKQENTVLENLLIDVIYSLDVKYYYPIVTFIDEPQNIYNEYLNDNFIVVIEQLQRLYNFYAKNNNVIYNLNRNTKQLVVEDYIKRIISGNKEGFVSRGKSDKFVSIRKLKEFLEGVEDTKLTNKAVKDVLNKYGYDINLSCTKRDYIEVYRVYVLGHEAKVRETYKKSKRVVELTLDQSIDIEKYIDSNLKLDKLLRTNKDIDGHLRLVDVRNLLENMLNIKQLSVEEIYEILLQCNYNLDLKSGSKQIDGVKVQALKIEKIK